MQLGPLPLFAIVAGFEEIHRTSLAQLSGVLQTAGANSSSLVRRAAIAWQAPLEQLTCEQARLLVGQGMGLRWLSQPVCALLKLRPDAEVTLYAGDLARAVLERISDFIHYAPESTREFLAGDFSWIDDLQAADREFGDTSGEQAEQLLTAARRAIAN